MQRHRHDHLENILIHDIPGLTSQINTDGNNLFNCLLKDKLCRDVTFVLKGGTTIDAHKTVLSIQSPVFRKMLTSNMVESKTGRIEL